MNQLHIQNLLDVSGRFPRFLRYNFWRVFTIWSNCVWLSATSITKYCSSLMWACFLSYNAGRRRTRALVRADIAAPPQQPVRLDCASRLVFVNAYVVPLTM